LKFSREKHISPHNLQRLIIDLATYLKQLLSYFIELPVEKVNSKVSSELNISLIRGKYCLSTKNAVYSFEDQYSSFKTVFKNLKIEQRDIHNTLILGYGLGSIPILLNNNHGIFPHITAVELDPVVILLAEKYGYLPATVAMVQDDAYHYVLHSDLKFELINADLYVDDATPPQFEKEEFLKALKKLLVPGGLLLFSRFYYDIPHRKLTDNFRKNVFENIFPNSYTVNTKGNLMLVWEE